MKGISSYSFPMYKKAWDIVNYRDKYRNFPLASTVAMPLEIQPEHVYQSTCDFFFSCLVSLNHDVLGARLLDGRRLGWGDYTK
jgi:hypothetical protein